MGRKLYNADLPQAGLEEETENIVFNMFNGGFKMTINMRPFQKQSGEADYGLFALVVVTALAFVTRFAKTRHNSACINFQYKANVKLSAKNIFHKNTCSVFIGP